LKARKAAYGSDWLVVLDDQFHVTEDLSFMKIDPNDHCDNPGIELLLSHDAQISITDQEIHQSQTGTKNRT